MIQRSKGTKLPKSVPTYKRLVKPKQATKAAAPKFVELEEEDFRAAVRLVGCERPDAFQSVNACMTLTLGAQLLETALIPVAGEPWKFVDAISGMDLTALPQGLFIAIADRRGVMPWDELAVELRGEVPLDSNGPAVKERGEDRGSRGEGQKNGKPPKGSKPAPPSAPPPKRPAASASIDVELKHVEPNPFQPRHEFDAAELKSLGASIRSDGLLHPLLLRPTPGQDGHYQIVDGERRWRAAKSAGLHTLPAVVRETSDEQMATLAMTANLERKNLSAIEEAAQFKLLCETFGYTQQRLADTFRQTPGQISNRLRLLELPQAWQQRIISQEIGPTHARALVPYAKYPAILDDMAKELKDEPDISVPEWEDSLTGVIERHSRPLSGYFYEPFGKERRSGNVAFKPTDDQAAALEIIEIKRYGNKHKVCLNVDLWTELQLAAEKRKADRAEKAATKGKLTTPKGGKPVKKKSASDLAAAFNKRLQFWKTNWLRKLCHDALEDRNITARSHVPMKVLLWLAVENAVEYGGDFGNRTSFYDRPTQLAVAAGGKHSRDGWAILTQHGAEEYYPLACKFIGRLLWTEKDGPCNCFPNRIVAAIAGELEIDLAKAWTSIDQAELSAYLSLHGKEQLATLAKELKVSIDLGQPKGQIVLAMLDAPATKKRLPAELLKGKAGKR